MSEDGNEKIHVHDADHFVKTVLKGHRLEGPENGRRIVLSSLFIIGVGRVLKTGKDPGLQIEMGPEVGGDTVQRRVRHPAEGRQADAQGFQNHRRMGFHEPDVWPLSKEWVGPSSPELCRSK